jgi:hypothetical protein
MEVGEKRQLTTEELDGLVYRAQCGPPGTAASAAQPLAPALGPPCQRAACLFGVARLHGKMHAIFQSGNSIRPSPRKYEAPRQ